MPHIAKFRIVNFQSRALKMFVTGLGVKLGFSIYSSILLVVCPLLNVRAQGPGLLCSS